MPSVKGALSVILLGSYPLIPLIFARQRPSSAPQLPATVDGLLRIVVLELGIFSLFLGAAFALVWPSREALFLRWRGGWEPVVRGALYAAACLVGLSVLGGLAAAIAVGLFGVSPEQMCAFQPEIERVVDPGVLRSNPLYLFVATTLISFVLAGAREELWRSAMLSGVRHLAPARFGAGAQRVAVLGVALLFGLGHATQGVAGIIATALLGVAFGAILVVRGSLWEAALAHGFFDAANFLLLAWRG